MKATQAHGRQRSGPLLVAQMQRRSSFGQTAFRHVAHHEFRAKALLLCLQAHLPCPHEVASTLLHPCLSEDWGHRESDCCSSGIAPYLKMRSNWLTPGWNSSENDCSVALAGHHATHRENPQQPISDGPCERVLQELCHWCHRSLDKAAVILSSGTQQRSVKDLVSNESQFPFAELRNTIVISRPFAQQCNTRLIHFFKNIFPP